jgi:hypothetical protein
VEKIIYDSGFSSERPHFLHVMWAYYISQSKLYYYSNLKLYLPCRQTRNGVRELLYSIRVRMNSNRLIHGPDVHGGGRSHAQTIF